MRLHADWKRGVATHGGGMHHLSTVVVHLPRREPPEHLPKGHVTFNTSERGPNAKVRSVSEREMTIDTAPDVESVGVREVALVAIAGTVQKEECGTPRNRLALELGVGCHPAAVHR